MPDQVIRGTAGRNRGAGFTLIEMLIALVLGMAVALVAFSGVRVASQAVTIGKRLAKSNELLAIGVHMAMEEVDRWDRFDDPSDVTRQRLRASSSPAGAPTVVGGTLKLGLPFNPLTNAAAGAVWSADSSQNWGNGYQDDERLWAISADNELTWWTGNKAETLESDCRFGHYAIFGLSRKPSENPVTIDGGVSGAVGGWQPRNGGGVYGQVNLGTDGAPPTTGSLTGYRRQTTGWLANQTHGLGDALGWYGMLDYLPANAIVCYTAPYRPMTGNNYSNSPGDATDAAGRPIFLIKTFSKESAAWQFPDKPYYVLQSFSPNWAPHGMDFLTSYTVYSLIPPNSNRYEATTGVLSLDNMLFQNRSVARMESHDIPIGTWGSNTTNDFVEPKDPTALEVAGADVFTAFVNRTSSTDDIQPIHPRDWPDVSVSVARYLRLCRFSTQLKVSWFDPLTADTAELRFTAMGSSLRGARRNRNLDP